MTERRDEAVAEWLKVYHAYHVASDAYNARVILARAERERGSWGINTNPEYQALCRAQADAYEACEGLYQALIADGERMQQED